MTPDQLAKSGTEHAHQVALFSYTAVAHLHGFEVADSWAAGDKTALWCSSYHQIGKPALPCLKWFHAIPNGGSRGDTAKSRAKRGGEMKAEGVRSGVADCFLPCSNVLFRNHWDSDQWFGLYIELKKPSVKPKSATAKGGMSDEQIEFREYCLEVGYQYKTCYSWHEAVNELKAYLMGV